MIKDRSAFESKQGTCLVVDMNVFHTRFAIRKSLILSCFKDEALLLLVDLDVGSGRVSARGRSHVDERLVGREEEDFLDVGLVREEHDEPVNTESPSARRRQSVLESITRAVSSSLPQSSTWRERTDASMKVSSKPWASSSPCAFCFICSSKLAFWTNGSFNSV